MQFAYTEELRQYMEAKGKSIIIVEIASSDSSDFNVEEFHIHFTDEKQAELFKKRQHFHEFRTDCGKVLLPNYRLEYDPVVTFGLKKVLFLHLITQTGIHF